MFKKFKKLVLSLMLLGITSFASAGIITFDPVTSNTGIDFTWLNNTYGTAFNTINGGIASINIENGSINSVDINVQANPLVFNAETVGEYVYTGLTLPSTGLATAGTITAGTAYVKCDEGTPTLHRVVKGADSLPAVTNGNVNYIYLGYTGTYVANTSGTEPTNSILLGTVTVNGGGTITAASETSRQTVPPNLRVPIDLKIGLVVSRDVTTATTVSIDRGSIEFGSTVSNGLRRNTINTNINLGVAGEGGLDTGTIAGSTFYYLFGMPSSANSTNYTGVASTSAVLPTGTAFASSRLIGWAYVTADSTIPAGCVGAYRGRGGDAPNIAKVSANNMTLVITSATTGNVSVPLKFYSSGRPLTFSYGIGVATGGADDGEFFISMDSIIVAGTDYHMSTSNTGSTGFGGMRTFDYTLDAGEHTVTLKYKPRSQNATINWNYLKVEEK